MTEVLDHRSGAPAPRRPATSPGSATGGTRLRRVAALDGLRVLAALGVVVYHAMGAVLGANPTAGVIIPPAAFTFFLISGFVIHRPFAAAHLAGSRGPDPRGFWANRVVRVMPLWWVAVATYLVVQGNHLHGPGEWVATLTLFQYVVPSARYAVVGPAWALSVEWIFYLAAPLLALGIRRLHRAMAPTTAPERVQYAVLGALGVLCAGVGPLRPFVAIIIGMAFGVLDAVRHERRRTPRWLPHARSGAVTVLVTAVGWVVLAGYHYREGLSVQWVQQDPLVLAIWITVATSWFLPVAFGPAASPVNRRLGAPLVVAAGQLTFGIYLWHDLVLQRTVRVLGLDANVYAVGYLTLLGAVALAALTYQLVERPCLGLRRRFLPSAPAPVDADVAVAEAAAGPSGADPAATSAPAAPAGAPGRGWITSIDGLRVIAAFCVVSFHVGAEKHLPAWASQSLAAICIPVFSTFFVVSGFVLYRPWAMAQARIDLGDGRRPTRAPDGGALNFYLRRILRVYPVYWVVQGCALAISGTGDLSGFTDWFQMITLFPLPHFDVIIHHGLGVIVWTMIVELAYYLVLPAYGRITLFVVDRGLRFVPANAIPLGLLLVVFAYGGSTNARVLAVACCIVTGMMFAALDAWQRTTRRWVPAVRAIAKQPSLALPVIVVSWAIGTIVARNDDPDLLFRTYLPVHLAAMLAVSTVLFLPAVFAATKHPYRRFLSAHPMRVLGPLTFGVYLWHYPVIRRTAEHVDLPLLGLWSWALLAAVSMAALTYRFVELPVDRFRHRHLGRTSSAPAPEPADRSPR